MNYKFIKSKKKHNFFVVKSLETTLLFYILPMFCQTYILSIIIVILYFDNKGA